MSVSPPLGARLAIVSRDVEFCTGLHGWLDDNDGDLMVDITVSAWGDLLNSSHFPTDIVVLDAASSKRNSIESRVRTIRASGTAVIVMKQPDLDDDLQRAVSAGAFCVLDKSVPFGLIDEMARAAVGLPLAHGVG